MGHHSEAFIGIDTSKLRNAVAVAEAGRKGEVRYLGEFDTSTAATRKLVAKLAAQRVWGWSAGFGGGSGVHAPGIRVPTARGRGQSRGTGFSRHSLMADARGCDGRAR